MKDRKKDAIIRAITISLVLTCILGFIGYSKANTIQSSQEISILVLVLLCVVVLSLIALVISRAVKRQKTPVIFYILLTVFVVILGCVIFATVVAGNPHSIAPPA